MAKTVVGLFDTTAEAQSVVQELINSGFERNDISLMANNAKGEYSATREVGATGSSTAEGAGAGAVGGGVLGGVFGLLVGVGALAIPGIGPVLAAGPLAAALGAAGASTLVGAGIGAAAGGIIGALVGAGIPEEDAGFYAEGVRRGGTLVLVKSSDDMAQRAYDAMRRYGAVDVDERSGNWRSSGWSGFSSDAEPYTSTTDTSYGRTTTAADRPYTGTTDVDDKWQRSSKVGTTGGAVAGAATGAAIGAVGGPVGMAVGGVAGAVTGAGVGAAGDVVGEKYSEGDFDSYDNDFRTHYQSSASNTGYTYDQYTPVYRYGYGLANDPMYRDRDWSMIETDARTRWEERNPGTWEQFKDSVHYAWDKARGAR